MDGNLEKIRTSIEEVEKKTRAEVRVHLSSAPFDFFPLKSAHKVMNRLGMKATKERNAVLLYVNIKRRKYAIAADDGIVASLAADHWTGLASRFRDQARGKGWVHAVTQIVADVGKDLARIYPVEPGNENSNELSDEVSQDS